MRLIIVDDHAIVRKGLIQILTMEETLPLSDIDEAESAPELFSKLREKNYDLVILDISMPGRDGLDILKELKTDYPKLPVLMLSTFSEDQYAVRSLKAGAAGYIRKSRDPGELVNAIKAVYSGRKYFSTETAEKLLDLDREQMPHEVLSDREYQIMKMIAVGKTQKEIAEDLFLSIKTVSTYRRRILDKMNFESNHEITEYCLSNELIQK